jgi:hypothetical protein
VSASASTRSPESCSTVYVIVTCTNRKSLPVPSEVRLGSMSGQSVAQRVRAWIARLSTYSSVPLSTAIDLYAGEHWAIARSMQGLGAGHQIQLWVCSAGYGLIPATASVRPYAATFSAGPDSVPGGADGARQWWQALAEWEGPEQGHPRTIQALAAANPSASILIAVSAVYLRACRDDIDAAAGELPDLDRIMVVSVGTRHPGPLAELMIPADARLRIALGGTLQALNARIAARLLAEGITSRAEAVQYMTDLLASQPSVQVYDRKKLSDQEISAWIAGRLAQAPTSRLLREFREAGYACEQQRFARLHGRVAGVDR